MATDDWASGKSAKHKSGTADKASASDLAGKDDAAVGQSARARQELTKWQAASRQQVVNGKRSVGNAQDLLGSRNNVQAAADIVIGVHESMQRGSS